MKHIVSIDDKTQTGKNLLGVIKSIAKQTKSIEFINEEADTVPFEDFATLLRNGIEERYKTKKS